MSKRTQALIVGAGPTGLVMPHELARDGIQCRLIDKAPHRAMELRAIAIHSRTVETFELMGFADDFLRAGHRITGGNMYGESGRIAHAAFGMLETRYPFVLGVPQGETERIIGESVARLGVRAERNTELVSLAQRESGVSARLRTADRVEEVEPDCLLGCDGARSTVREQLGISFAGATYPEHFVLADVKVAGELDHAEAQVWLHRDGSDRTAMSVFSAISARFPRICPTILPSSFRRLPPVERPAVRRCRTPGPRIYWTARVPALAAAPSKDR